MHRSLLSASGIALLFCVLVLFNGISKYAFSGWTWDLSEEGLYSLSYGTRQILSKIEDPVVLRLFFSKTDSAKFPAVKLYGKRIIDLLHEYENASGGNIRLEVYDPRPDSTEEEWAQKYGISPIPTATGERLFLGLAGASSDGEEETVPVFDLGRQHFLEYDITKLVHSLSRSKKAKVGIVSSIDLNAATAQAPQGGVQEWMFISQMQQIAEVEILDKGVAHIGNDITLLVVIHPKELTDATLYAIDQHVMRGGNLLVLVDPYCEADKGDPNSDPRTAYSASKASSLPLLSKWGVEMQSGKAVADINLATQVNAGQGAPLEPFVLWLNLGRENINREDLTTSGLEDMLLPWAGSLAIKPVDGVTATSLLTTSKDSMLIEDSKYRFGGGRPAELLQGYFRGDGEKVLAARLSGKFKSNYQDGVPKAGGAVPESSSENAQHLLESKEASNIIVIADTDFIANRFSLTAANFFGNSIVTMRNGNLVLFLNAVENLLGSNDLIGIRSRGQFTRPFTKVLELEARAEQRWRQEEKVFEAKLADANNRLTQYQRSANMTGEGADRVFDKRVIEEIRRLRQERQEVQQQLRDVRRNLRQDKEKLGEILFVLNTFFVPLLLVGWSVAVFLAKQRKGVKK